MITGVFKLDQFLFTTNKIQDKICLQLNSLWPPSPATKRAEHNNKNNNKNGYKNLQNRVQTQLQNNWVTTDCNEYKRLYDAQDSCFLRSLRCNPYTCRANYNKPREWSKPIGYGKRS